MEILEIVKITLSSIFLLCTIISIATTVAVKHKVSLLPESQKEKYIHKINVLEQRTLKNIDLMKKYDQELCKLEGKNEKESETNKEG